MSDDLLIYTAEITVYDPNIAATRVLYYSTKGFTTTPSETPANTFFDEKITQPTDMSRYLFGKGTTQGSSLTGSGDLKLANGNGDLDAFITYGLDGRAITIRQGTLGAAYPSAFTTVVVATMQQPECGLNEITIRLRDRQAELNVPLQTTKYAGDNVLPAGLEGVAADLKGKPKPVAYGTPVNCPCPCVNTAKLIYQANDSAIASVTAYDRGIQLASGAATWAAQTSGAAGTIIRGLAYSPSLVLWVWVGDAGKLFTSPDLVTWTVRTSQFGANNIRGVCRSEELGLFIAVGDAGVVSTSPDGITWTLGTSGFGATNIRAVAAGLTPSGTVAAVIVGDSGKLAYSANGTTFTLGTSGFGGAVTIRTVAYGQSSSAGFFVAAGDSGTITWSPAASVSAAWTLATGTIAAQTYLSVTFAKDKWITGTALGSIAYSQDGKTWTSPVVVFPANPSLNALTYASGIHAVVGSAAILGTATDVATWFSRTNPGIAGATALNAVASNGSTFAVAGDAGVLYTSALVATYATLADLSDDTLAPALGTIKYYAAGGYFRLGSPPAGLVTADVVQGAAAADRTAAQIFKLILTRKGYTGADYSAADIAALDVANPAVLGFYADEELKFNEALDMVAGSVGAAWYVDRTGVFRIKQFVAPTGTPVASFTADDTLPFVRVPVQDPDAGIPVYRVIVRYGKSYAVQDTDLAAGVTQARREIVNKEWREAKYDDNSVQTAHVLSPQIVVETLLTNPADALAEATRLGILKGIRRDRVEIIPPLTPANAAIDLSNVVELVHTRYGYATVGSDVGKLFVVMGVEPDAKNKTLTLNLWGPNRGGENLVSDTGALFLTDTGAYLIASAG